MSSHSPSHDTPGSLAPSGVRDSSIDILADDTLDLGFNPQNDLTMGSLPSGTPRSILKPTTPTASRFTPGMRPPSSLRFETSTRQGANNYTPRNHTPRNRGGRQSQGARQAAAATPHRQAADKVKEMRRRAIINTPGRARRQSVRVERQDPMENLRRLARNLAPKTQAIPSSDSISEPADATAELPDNGRDEYDDDDDDDDLLEEPRSRILLDSDSDDLDAPRQRELQEAVERTRVLEEMDLTTYSVEIPRRMAPRLPDDARLPRRSSMFEASEVPMSDGDATAAMAFHIEMSPQHRLPLAGDESEFGIEVPEAPTMDDESTVALGGDQGRESGLPADFVLPLVAEDDFSDGGAGDDGGIGEPFFDAGFGDNFGDHSDAGVDEIGSDSDGAAEAIEDVEATEAAPFLRNDAVRPDADLPRPVPQHKKARGGKRHALAIPDRHVKNVAARFMKRNGGNPRFSKETMDRLGVMTDWYFERLGKSLEAYASHAGRKTLREADMHLIMQRQRITNATVTPFFLANKHLDASLQRLIRNPPPNP